MSEEVSSCAAADVEPVGRAGVRAANTSADCMEMLWWDQIEESK